MSETKRTVEGRECCYCHRNLPITYFPLKPGKKYVRYKACRDCHPLGHSCIPKPEPKRRKFATEEERKAAKREYLRRWREAHKEEQREKKSEKYQQTKSEAPPKEPKKPGRKKRLTDEERKARRREYSKRWNQAHRDKVNEYQRKRYQRIKEKKVAKNAQYQKEHPEVRAKAHAKRKAKAEQEAAGTGRFYCTCCKQIMPAEEFTENGRQYKLCNDCRLKLRVYKQGRVEKAIKERKPKGENGTSPRVDYHRQYWQEHKDEIKAARIERAMDADRKIKAMKKEPEDKLCWKCWLYPCFDGIDNMESDFAKEGCVSFRMKEDAS